MSKNQQSSCHYFSYLARHALSLRTINPDQQPTDRNASVKDLQSPLKNDSSYSKLHQKKHIKQKSVINYKQSEIKNNHNQGLKTMTHKLSKSVEFLNSNFSHNQLEDYENSQKPIQNSEVINIYKRKRNGIKSTLMTKEKYIEGCKLNIQNNPFGIKETFDQMLEQDNNYPIRETFGQVNQNYQQQFSPQYEKVWLKKIVLSDKSSEVDGQYQSSEMCITEIEDELFNKENIYRKDATAKFETIPLSPSQNSIETKPNKENQQAFKKRMVNKVNTISKENTNRQINQAPLISQRLNLFNPESRYESTLNRLAKNQNNREEIQTINKQVLMKYQPQNNESKAVLNDKKQVGNFGFKNNNNTKGVLKRHKSNEALNPVKSKINKKYNEIEQSESLSIQEKLKLIMQIRQHNKII